MPPEVVLWPQYPIHKCIDAGAPEYTPTHVDTHTLFFNSSMRGKGQVPSYWNKGIATWLLANYLRSNIGKPDVHLIAATAIRHWARATRGSCWAPKRHRDYFKSSENIWTKWSTCSRKLQLNSNGKVYFPVEVGMSLISLPKSWQQGLKWLLLKMEFFFISFILCWHTYVLEHARGGQKTACRSWFSLRPCGPQIVVQLPGLVADAFILMTLEYS